MKPKALVFVALPYANGALHLGQIAGAYLPYDAFRRFMKLRGVDLITASGSDEHGTPITLRSIREGIPPEVIASKYHKINRDIFEKMGIEFDAYIETSSDIHKKIVGEFITRLKERGFIYESEMIQPFCVKEGIFLADRYVTGKCPHCGYELATGDQCENCGSTLEPSELIDPVCIFDRTTPEFRKTTHLFFKLSALQDELKTFVESNVHWRQNVIRYSTNFIKEGLKDRPITRDLSWGVQVPFEGYENKRIYVWFEALIGYLTGTSIALGSYEDALALWSDREIRHYYFMGKDNIAFHSIIWPGMLMAHGDMTLPYFIAANEYLNFKGEKFSKSRGTGVSMPEMLSRYDPEYIRFGVFYNLPEEHDSDFSIEEFQSKVNTELIDKFGNFVNRALVLAFKHGPVSLDQIAQNDIDVEAENKIRQSLREIIERMERVNIREAFKSWMDLAYYGNSYITRRKPWEACRKEGGDCNAAIYTGVKIVFALAVSGQIFLPRTSKLILSWLGHQEPVMLSEDLQLPVARLSSKPERLFEKIVDQRINLKLIVARIEKVEDHPNAEKLYVLDLDLGSEKRRIISGIKDSYSPSDLIGKKIIMVYNLKPASIRGLTSNGMLLAAEDEKGVHLLLAPETVKEGEQVDLGGLETDDSELTIDEFRKMDIKTHVADGKTLARMSFGDRSFFLKVREEYLYVDGSPREGLKIK
ncbi:MAG: methionine--tRNA ligase [Thermoplasmata archaeon]